MKSHGSEQDDASLFSGCRQNVIFDNLPYEVRTDGTRSNTVETTSGMIERIKKFIQKYEVKALMSLGDAWKQAFFGRA